MSGKIHLWDSLTGKYVTRTKCGIQLALLGKANVLFASTAESLKIPPDRVCKVCYRLGPPWLGEVK